MAISCMGYEIAGGLGVKMADPSREVIVMVGDGSYLMMNSEIATAVMLGLKLIIVVLDNAGFGCINRLQRSTGQAGFNNLLADTHHATLPAIDFAAHAASLGAKARKVASIAELEGNPRRCTQEPRYARHRHRYRCTQIDERWRALVGCRNSASVGTHRGA